MDRSWYGLEARRTEWPQASLDPHRDLAGLQRGLELYERDDYPTMMQCAILFATALAHSLYGPGLLRGSDLPETVHKTLYCSLCAPPDRRTFADSAQRAARLALTLVRENGWVPPALGGTFGGFEPMIMDRGNYMLLTTAIAPADEPFAGNLTDFFAVPVTPLVGEVPDARASRGVAAIEHLDALMVNADSGDHASSLHLEGLASQYRGDLPGALARFTEAARLGHVPSMTCAGDVERSLGHQVEADFWYETAASAGDPLGMFNTGIAAYSRGDRAVARTWLQRAAEAGNSEGFGALTQMADEDGDETAEAHWARLGAEAGQLFCMTRHGLLLARSAGGDSPTLRRSREFLEQAARRGDLAAAELSISVNLQLGDSNRAREFVTHVVDSGDAERVDRLRRHGLI